MDDAHAMLLQRMRAGDEGAARALWDALSPRLTALARALLRARSASGPADDVVQSAFVRVLELGEAEARAIRSPAAYLARAVHTGALNVLRDRARRARRESTHAEHLPANGSPFVRADHDAVSEAVDALDGPLREAVLLRHAAGLTFDEMAEATGTPRATLASRHAAALERLREALPAPTQSSTGAAS